jgi:hypothetical protein
VSNTFCPLPWNSINVRNNGNLRICCHANSYTKNRGILRKDDGTPYNAGFDDWDEARNSSLLKEVRKTMMEGNWHPECERCRQEEINGIQSRREYESADWGEELTNTTYETVKEHTADDGTIDTDKFEVNYLDMRYGNFCNLKCRMCGPTDSHKWYDDHVKMTNTTKYWEITGPVQLEKNKKGKWSTNLYDWFMDNPQYQLNFDKVTKTLKKIYIVGGEPLIIPEHYEALCRLIDLGRAPDIQLEYNTNLTNVTENILTAWKEFQQVRVGASIDGYGDVFEYQRFPGKWHHIYENMLELDANHDINLKGWMAFTITTLNVFHLPKFMKWKLEESKLTKFNPLKGMRPIITEHLCHNPKYYNIKVLPEYIKEQVTDNNNQHIEWIKSTDYSDHVKKKFVKILEGTNKFMNAEQLDEEHLIEFIKTTNKLDEIRNQNIVDVVPEYKGLF